MRTLTQEQLKEILEKHQLWLNDEPDGERADLNFCDLSGADLRSADLSCADLRSADLRSADLSYADLSHANLSYADLRRANLSNAILSFANLYHANLSYAILYHAGLSYANLCYADLHHADLSYAILSYANLYRANLGYAKNIPFIPLACPCDGAFIGWKKVRSYIIKLEIPENARRSSATTSKCRCEFARVLEIQNLDGTKADVDSVENNSYSQTVRYTIGETVYPDSFDADRWNECSHGIHFFINRQEAVNYL